METIQNDFQEKLEYGKEFEDIFSKFLISKGYYVIPKYLYTKEGAPMLFGLKDNFCVPDIDASKEKNRIWVECKRKKRMRSHPATGYPQKYHDHYRKVQEITGNKVFVVFEDDTDGTINWYGNWLDEMEKFIYRENWNIQGKPHILFKYPEAFIKINKTISSV